ncbi:VOC family protein [Thermomonospora umbrina]|uniref:Catechol 2,3-dioxygenase-like lactoylglutathione lyase family enzyme n=1 Tax=Thermomonospora umbrina TaxID=111806 RepID=A0A3D9SNG9_9ACTN|nr:VOC family protein [Thermomonospora umbrina]REE97418.1 catechol 2,3-dioxygenase-like lactoylglutathione lyase family enzyme [Thermomonospora umbrina]
MQISNVLAGVAVSDLPRARRWYESLFGRGVDAEPMAGLVEWHTPGGVVQLVSDPERAGGSLVTLQVPDARQALTELAERDGPTVDLDDTTSDKVLFARVTDPDGNAITVVQVREGVRLSP